MCCQLSFSSTARYLSAVKMKSVKNSSMVEKEGGERGPTTLEDGKKKRLFNLEREKGRGSFMKILNMHESTYYTYLINLCGSAFPSCPERLSLVIITLSSADSPPSLNDELKLECIGCLQL